MPKYTVPKHGPASNLLAGTRIMLICNYLIPHTTIELPAGLKGTIRKLVPPEKSPISRKEGIYVYIDWDRGEWHTCTLPELHQHLCATKKQVREYPFYLTLICLVDENGNNLGGIESILPSGTYTSGR